MLSVPSKTHPIASHPSRSRISCSLTKNPFNTLGPSLDNLPVELKNIVKRWTKINCERIKELPVLKSQPSSNNKPTKRHSKAELRQYREQKRGNYILTLSEDDQMEISPKKPQDQYDCSRNEYIMVKIAADYLCGSINDIVSHHQKNQKGISTGRTLAEANPEKDELNIVLHDSVAQHNPHQVDEAFFMSE